VRSNHNPRAGMVLLALTVAAYLQSSGAAVRIPNNAIWAEHDLRVELQHLSRNYSCDDLSSKIRDVLESVGARADVRIFVNRCGNGMDARVVAPRVHVIFSLPLELRGRLAWSADFYARERTVRIEPGVPPSIDDWDCELLRQVETNLLRPASLTIEAIHLPCAQPTTRHSGFGPSIEALMPEMGGPAKASSGSLPDTRAGVKHG